MSKKNTKKIEGEDFIPGVYNYCDRWCDRCHLQQQCMSYVIGKKLEEKKKLNMARLSEENRREGNLWSRLRMAFDAAYKALHELSEERGISVEEIFMTEKYAYDLLDDDDEETKSQPGYINPDTADMVLSCCIYEHFADKCIEQISESESDNEKNEELSEAIEVVNWYLDLIQSKLRRALHGYNASLAGKNNGEYYGSAKVAMLLLDRSIQSWKIIQFYCPELHRDIAQLLFILNQVRTDADKQFPNALAFMRPGFDY